MVVADSPRHIILVSMMGWEQRVTRIVNRNILSNHKGRQTGQSTHQSVAIQSEWGKSENRATYNRMGGKRMDTIRQSGTGLIRCHGCDKVEAPPDHKIINSKCVFKIKCRPNSEIDKYKAHLVTKGYMQVEGLNYTDTFAPVTKFTTICSLLTLSAQHDLEVHQIDVKAAFLNGE